MVTLDSVMLAMQMNHPGSQCILAMVAPGWPLYHLYNSAQLSFAHCTLLSLGELLFVYGHVTCTCVVPSICC